MLASVCVAPKHFIIALVAAKMQLIAMIVVNITVEITWTLVRMKDTVTFLSIRNFCSCLTIILGMTGSTKPPRDQLHASHGGHFAKSEKYEFKKQQLL